MKFENKYTFVKNNKIIHYQVTYCAVGLAKVVTRSYPSDTIYKNVNNKYKRTIMPQDLKDTYLNLLKNCLLDNIYGKQKIVNGGLNQYATKKQIEEGIYWPDRAHTMIGEKRLDNIRYCIEQCLETNIPGDLIE